MIKKRVYRISDAEFNVLARKYPNMTRSEVDEIGELLANKMFAGMALSTRVSEIELLKNRALGAMGTDNEMSFSDIESGMLKASLSDGRQALKEIVENVPIEAPLCNDGTQVKRIRGAKKET